jgi:GH15 family glucan-1,4-alpha-glucosidase
MEWLAARSHELEKDDSLQIMYGIEGQHELTEIILDHLEGYRGSAPVRIGNAAHRQLQLDIYGELMDSVYLFNKYGSPISYELWMYLHRLLDYVCDNWQKEDEGIWEVRSGRRHFVFSKLMCSFWLVEALTRAGRFDRKRLDTARLVFEQMLGYANHLGLYGEETGPRGEALGNFPQAFTHLALISAAFNLDRALDSRY